VSHEEGIRIINKPRGITSHDVVNAVRRITGERRVGHAGTLDPLASGVLIVLVGKEATRRQAEFMGLPKVYEGEITFGSTSATEDGEGPFTKSATFEQLQQLTADHVRAVLPQFIGTIQQRPPAHSAIRVGGRRLYEKARAGEITVEEIPMRTVQIDRIELLNFIHYTPPFPPTARIRVHCQKGTYIRSLARDIGAAVGVGGYLSDLVRTAVGDFRIENAETLPPRQTQDRHSHR
jgi:tRNA pseudouridine55 synthase